MTGLHGARVLVTGGAGFIGSHLVDELLGRREAASVTVVDNLVNGSRANLVALGTDPRLDLVAADVRDTDAMADALDGVDVVFHLACLGVRHSLHAPLENHEVNATGTLLLLEQARAAGMSRFVHVSSSEVFGTAQYAPMDERHPTWPETVYGGSKLAGEAYARAAFRTHGFPVVVARPFNTYGPRSHFEGDSGEVLPRTIVRALCGLPGLVFGDGEQTRDLMHVSDTASGLADLGECDAAVGQTVNLGSGSEVTINDLCTTVARLVGRPDLEPVHLDPRPGDVRRLLVDSTRMRSLTGFVPRTSFEDGVAELVEWFRSGPSTPQEMLSRIEDTNWVSARPSTAVRP
ncbi:MAG: NAD-dependent epimerase/dehydratase family protein [Cellulomonas sp.]|uniref:dTDP-glucose 4,6-dehydratase n=1 Tax=Cellulomonas sp. TaxID=40001 RepID=UPI0017B391F5|nr:GDP-mannose 4,6-dehydratase [Cellulomonas sp.]NMM16945.1 NAD-dependent epimerase/dehydratase family protein [Cellulomonas sp.]NMM30782.1 NAD-dependent epimerase/dehydratase family protein [Cellulomonas sp.]